MLIQESGEPPLAKEALTRKLRTEVAEGVSQMSSIAGTLNSINNSLLTEIQSFSNAKTGANPNTDPATVSSDRIDFSQVGNLFKQLRELQSSDPAEFKQVLTDAVSKLKDAAGEQTDPRATAFLDNLADRFQQAADTGDLSVLHPQSPNGTGGAHGHRGHRAEGPGDAENDGDADDGSAASPVSTVPGPNTTQSLFSLLNSYTNSQDQSPLATLLSGQSGQNGSSPESVLVQILGAGQQGSNSTQIQSLLASFVTTSNGSV